MIRQILSLVLLLSLPLDAVAAKKDKKKEPKEKAKKELVEKPKRPKYAAF